jgi:hypothetical protein
LIRVLENEMKAMSRQSVAKKKLMKKAKTEVSGSAERVGW